MREHNFWGYVSKDPDGHWRWSGPVTPSGGRHGGGGYGKYAGTVAHRIAYELIVGPVPEGLQLDHLCGLRNCVNPAHLEPVTPQENTLRARGDSCKRGHKYTPENTHLHLRRDRPGPTRVCRTCARERRAA